VSRLLSSWYRIEASAGRGLLLLVASAPLGVVLAIAHFAGRAGYLLLRGRRRIALDNIRRSGICANEPEARALALASFVAFATMVMESIVARRRLTRDNWAEHVRLRLSTEVETLLLRPGQGLIVASAHLGNWEVAARAVSMIKPIIVAYRPFNNPHLDEVAHEARQGEQLRLVSRLEAHPLAFVGALARGEVVALMIDQHATRGRVAVRFFDRTAWATRSVAMLSLTSRVPLLVAFAVRTGRLRYEVHASGPLTFTRSGDREKDVAAITQALTMEVEKAVRRHPEQYLWGHRRWRG
jgi:Kdo2-lipid IVA lauroyltransferase/acyltransferase